MASWFFEIQFGHIVMGGIFILFVAANFIGRYAHDLIISGFKDISAVKTREDEKWWDQKTILWFYVLYLCMW